MLDSHVSSELTVAASEFVKEGEYWIKKLSGDLVKASFPYDKFPASGIDEASMQSVELKLIDECYSKLMWISKGGDHTLHMILVTGLVLLLHKYTGQQDIILGTPIYKQEMEGEFVNTVLALRNYIESNMSFKELLLQVRQTILEANENQNYPLETLLYRLNIPFTGTDFPLFDVVVLLENIHDKKYIQYTQPRMIFSFRRTGEVVEGVVEFNSSLYEPASVERIAAHFTTLLQEVLFHVNLPAAEINILSAEEQRWQLVDFCDTCAPYPADQTIHELIERQVSRTPGNFAVMSEGHRLRLTYSQLEAQANQVAGYLYHGKNIQPGDRVGVLMDNCPELVTAILGILKAGAAYVPMDPVLPEERIKLIIDDANLRLVISLKKHIRTLNRLQWECASFDTFLCMDSRDIYAEEEVEKSELMDEKLWDYVAETAVDEITGGGWNTSYTGEPFSQQEMDEYGDNVLEKLVPILRKAMRVLEIGCASGISMYRIAPGVAYYHGTDLSPKMIERNKERVKKENHKNITLSCLPAHHIDTIEDRNFDLIILNSVIQSFHGHNYLRKVIRKTIDLLGEQGYLFVGDIMDHELKDALMGDLMEFKRNNRDKTLQTKTDFSTELFVSRGFFEDLPADMPEISQVAFSNKIYTIENELTKYRYDALITVDKTGKARGSVRKKQEYQEDSRVLERYGTGKVDSGVTSHHPAYVIYTSGTTGTPRGVMIEHSSLVNYTWWAVKTYIAGKTTPVTVPLYSSISFDLTVTSLYLPLLTGGTIVIYTSEHHRFPVQQIVKEDRVDILKATPSHLKLLQHEITGTNRKLKTFIVGGEDLERSLAQDIYLGFSRRVDIYNEYGPTEATVGCMIYKFNYEKDRRRSVSIGLPADNVNIYILDGALNPVPINGIGEIYIGGAALACGYLNQPELTAEKFISIFNKSYRSYRSYISKKIYKTGDLARRFPDGNIEFLGRMDEQVKIRGYRIELKEIQSQLLTHSDVKEAVVIAKETYQSESSEGAVDKALCAYIVPEKDVEISELIAYLSVHLPGYMVPSYFMPVERIPLTPNGKVDKKALPEPQIQGTDDTYAAPENKIQVTLVEIWSKVLGIEPSVIGIDANFFELGGHSLKATILIAEIHKTFHVKVPLAEIFKHPFIRELANYIDRTAVEEFSNVQSVEKKDYYVLSSAQKRHYIIQQLELSGMGYNEYIFSMLEGQLDRERVEETFRQLIRRHESLRTSFHIVKDEPVQRVFDYDKVEFEIEYYDLATGGTESTGGKGEVERITGNFIRPFDLNQAPLLRVGLIKEDDEKHLLMVDMHHIITDGTSMGILKREFMGLYKGEEPALLEIQYKDFSEWQNSKAIRESMKQQESFWLKVFEGEIPVLELPADYSRPREKSFEGHSIKFALSIEVSGAVRELARQEEATMYMVQLAAFNILLFKLSACQDIIVGTPSAGRRHADLQSVIGMFVNTLAMRNYPRENQTFAAFLKEVKTRTLEAFENQDYQFEELVERLEVPRDTSRNPIFEVMFAHQNIEFPTVEIPQLRLLPYLHEEQATPFDFILHSYDVGQQLRFAVEYSTKLFKTDTINRIMDYFKKILSSVSAQPDQKISGIDLISGDEKNRILTQFNDTAGESPTNKTIPQLFEEQVRKTADHVALVGPPGHWALTYKELNRKSNQLARLLRQTGVGPDKVVGLLVERSFEMVMGLLAILKAGAAYLPIDSEYPEERILLMLSDSRAPALLTREKTLDRFSITSLKNLKASHQGLVVTPSQAQIKNFDGLPKPDRSLVNYEKYHQSIGVAMGKHTVSIQATRGCPFNCVFCHKLWPKTHIARSARGILEEIRCCYDAGVKRFVFIDDIFNLDKRNSAEIFEGIINQGLDLQLFFPNGLRGDILTKDFIDLMAAAGTVSLSMALESACPRIQRLIKKNLDLEKFEEIVRYIIEKHPHIILEMGLMLGFPTETEKEALMTLEFLESLKWVHFPNLHILKIYPNTDMFRVALANGISELSIERSANLAYHEIPETLPFPKHFVRQYQTRFMNGYFLSKERLLHVLPLQARTLAGGEFIRKYDSYLPMEINDLSDILNCAGLSKEDLGNFQLLPDHHMTAPDFNNKIKKHFPPPPKISNPLRVLLLDLSLLFRARQQKRTLYDMVDAPLGLMYLLTYLNEKFKGRVWGKIAKSRIDFDCFEELKTLAADFKPHLIGIRTLSFFKEFFHQTVLMIRKWGIDVPIITGGPYATSDYRLILQDRHVDLVVLGEGELVFSELLEKIMANNNQLPEEDVLQEIRGLAFVKNKFKNPKNKKEKTAPAVPGYREDGSREIVLLDEISRGMNQYPAGNLKPINQAGDALYVIYTSGSTGIPKAVMLEHRNLVNLMHYTFQHTQIDCSSVLQFATISFDVSFQEVFSTLLSGGKLVLVDNRTRGDIPGLFQVIEKNKIKTLFLPTAFLKFIFSEADYISLIPPGVRHLVTAGDQLVINDMLREYLKKNNVYLHNHYGPSETHVVTALTLDPQGEIPQWPSIGQPILNTGIYIMDQVSQLLPIGVPGELYIGGIQVGRGYLGKATLTKEKFIKNPFVKGDKLYKTGDRARWLPDRNIEFLGRIDHQVKIRGFRVEPGEIEKQLLMDEEIKEAVVVTKKDKKGDNYLCAYIVPVHETTADVEKKSNIKGIREFLLQALPDYMIPSYFIYLDKIPLTPNGKLNRRVLPEPGASGTGENYTPPGNDLEKKLAVIWSQVLDISRSNSGIDDNFFQLGGHSLKATILVSRIHKHLGVKVPLVQMFKTPTIRGLAWYIEKTGPGKFVAIKPVEKNEYYCLSSAQKRLYFLQQFDARGIGYNLAQQVPWQEGIEIERLEKTFRALITRHESLRTSFEVVDGEPVQIIRHEVEFEIENYDLKRQAVRPAEIMKNFVRPFDLSRAPLLRVGLIKPGETGNILLIDMHHIITDGTSQDILVEEFKALYRNRGDRLPGLRLQYKDYARWQIGSEHQEAINRQENYWRQVFSNDIPVLNLPIDYPRPSMQRYEGAVVYFLLNEERTENLKKSAKDNDVTVYMFILAVFSILLAKLGGQEDVIIGTPIAARRHADLEGIVGMFVNTLAVRSFIKGHHTFKQFLKEVKNNTINAFENQEYPFEELVENVSVDRDTSRNPLFDMMFTLLNQAEYKGYIPARDETSYNHIESTSKFDLSLTAVEIGEIFIFNIEYCTHLFKPGTIDRIIGYFKKIAALAAERPGQKISGIDFISEEEKKQVLFDFNDTEARYPNKTLHELFGEQVERTPHHAALVGKEEGKKEDVLLTYREINEKAGQLAYLLIEKGVKQDTIVGIMIARSVEMIIGILGIVKAGGAYMPIDPDYPDERKQYMLDDSGAKVLVSEGSELNKVSKGIEMIKPSELGEEFPIHFTHPTHPTQLCYVIYTSGTTGNPKGTMIQHYSLINRLNWGQTQYPIDESDILMQKTPFTFDVSVWEIFWWSITGARLCLLEPGGEKDPEVITGTVEKCKVTVMHFVPSMLNAFMDYVEIFGEIKRLSGLKQVIASGEELTVQQVETFNRLFYNQEKTKLTNLYGPTEAAIEVSYFDCPTGGDFAKIPIGKPIDNIRLLILDGYSQLQPIGVVGDLYIAGVGLARGYLNKPELTNEKFDHDLWDLQDYRDKKQKVPGKKKYMSYMSHRTYISKRVYRTGDLARWLTDGNIEFLGRRDNQVKIRGNRVELAEIENCLKKYEEIKEAVVTAGENQEGDKYLSAYIVSNLAIQVPELKEHLIKKLPEYMIPLFFIQIEEIPLTASGKIDRKSLPDPGQMGIKSETGIEAPRDDLEVKLLDIWSQVLGIGKDKIGIDSNFFEMGGQSLKAIRLVSYIHKEMNIKPVLMEIFKTPTIRGFSRGIKGLMADRFSSIRTAEEKEYYQLSSAQKRLYFLQQVDEQGTVYNMPTVTALEGGIDKDKFEETFRRLIHRHESLRTSFEMRAGQVIQRIARPRQVQFQIQYRESREPQQVIQEFIRPFDLSQEPLLRVGLAKIGEATHLLMVDMHHITADGISLQILVQDFMELDAGKELPALKFQYKDFIRWRNTPEETGAVSKQGEYWKKQFEGEIPVLELPTDYKRPAVQRFEGAYAGFEMGPGRTRSLKKLALQEGVTIYIVLLSIYNILLSKVSGQQDIIIGTPVTGRRHADIEGVIGMFVNTLPLRNYPHGQKPFRDFLNEVKERALHAFENQDYPFEDLVGQVVVNRDAGRNPLFDTVFLLVTGENPKGENLPESRIKPFPFQNKTAKFDITLSVTDIGERLLFTIGYCTKLFKRETMERFADYIDRITLAVTRDIERRVSAIEIISAEEKNHLMNELNDTAVGYPRDKTIHGIFAQQVEKTPDRAALIGETVSITYRELNRRSHQLAELLKEKGVQPGTIVGIMQERSIDMIVGILGILKAGGAYMPIDPEYPEERKQYMLADSGAKVLVSEGIEMIKPGEPGEEFPTHLNHPTQPCYIIYTSGTTGKPKGTIIEHRNAVRLLFNDKDLFDFNSTDVWTLFHSFCFDFSVWEMYGSLLYGGKLIVIPREVTRDPQRYLKILREKGVTILNQTPSAFYHIIEEENKRETKQLALRYVIFGGEALRPGRLKEWQERYPQVRLVNMYGITETTVHVTYKEITGKEIDNDTGNIGKPIPTLSTYITDENIKLLPIGIRGELCVGGEGVARGYLNRPELTARKFVQNPEKPSERLYRSGDVGRVLDITGEMEYLGRIDHQVKIRGYRIELGEIESLLAAHPQVKEAVVTAREMAAKASNDKNNLGNKYLSAYIVTDRELTLTELREYLSRQLPGYMIPSYFIRLEQIPLTSNGKVDRKALEAQGRQLYLSTTYTAPQNEIETKIANVWKEVIHLEKVGIHDNYFELGGTSLDILKINMRLAEIFQVKVPVVIMFIHTTVHSLAKYLLDEAAEIRDRAAALERGKQDKMRRLQRRRRDRNG